VPESMRLRKQLLAVRVATWLVVAVLAVLLIALLAARGLGLILVLAVPLLAYVPYVARRTMTAVVRSTQVRLSRHVEANEHAQAREILRQLKEVYLGSAAGLEMVRVQEAGILTGEGRYGEAVTLLESVDVKQMAAPHRPWLLNTLAWALAQAGQGERAVAVARESMDASGQAGDRLVLTYDLRASQLGTLGAALVVAGYAEEAAPLLEQALARGGTGGQQAARALFLGDALQAMDVSRTRGPRGGGPRRRRPPRVMGGGQRRSSAGIRGGDGISDQRVGVVTLFGEVRHYEKT
jgi:hypothetical protein